MGNDGPVEAVLVAAVLKALRSLPGPSIWFKVHGSIFTKAGISDIIGCYLGNMFCIELKRTGKYTPVESGATPAQTKFLLQAKLAGAYTLIADDREDVICFVLATPER